LKEGRKEGCLIRGRNPRKKNNKIGKIPRVHLPLGFA
jgi:hypothetical protein